MLLQIPVDTPAPHFAQSVTLDGSTYQLELRYNGRMSRWVLNVRDAVGTAIICGVVMLAQRNLLGQYTTLALPPGVLFCANNATAPVQPTLSSFLTDTKVYYLEAGT